MKRKAIVPIGSDNELVNIIKNRKQFQKCVRDGVNMIFLQFTLLDKYYICLMNLVRLDVERDRAGHLCRKAKFSIMCLNVKLAHPENFKEVDRSTLCIQLFIFKILYHP